MPDPDDLPLLLGDVVICPEIAARNAPEHAGSFDDEIAPLVCTASSTCSARPLDDDERLAMQARERELLLVDARTARPVGHRDRVIG
jgi:hypothetical protein